MSFQPPSWGRGGSHGLASEDYFRGLLVPGYVEWNPIEQLKMNSVRM